LYKLQAQVREDMLTSVNDFLVSACVNQTSVLRHPREVGIDPSLWLWIDQSLWLWIDQSLWLWIDQSLWLWIDQSLWLWNPNFEDFHKFTNLMNICIMWKCHKIVISVNLRYDIKFEKYWKEQLYRVNVEEGSISFCIQWHFAFTSQSISGRKGER